jgi:hypothetical protein
MVTAALSRAHRGPGTTGSVTVDSAWVRTTAHRVRTLQARRSTWQVWHVRAEAHRQVRAANLPAAQVEAVVDLVRRGPHHRVGAPDPPQDGITNPPELRRRRRVQRVRGRRVRPVHQPAAILAAEQRLVATAGRIATGAGPARTRWIALLEQAANGVTLNAGQAALVTGMATSGARLQLAIAPAGTGKTTAMRALAAAAWVEDGGTVLGLAPSAAAAAASCVSSSARPPTPWPSSPGPSNTTTCPTGPEHRARTRWW